MPNTKYKIQDTRYQVGFTLIEVLIYTAITAVVGTLMLGILLSVSQVHLRESASTEVTGQLNFVTQTIGRLVRTASNIEITAGVSTSTIKLRMQDSAKDPTCISLVSGTIKLAEGPGTNPNDCSATTSDLTNTRVVVNALNFKKFVQYPGHDTVSYDVQMTYNSQNPKAQVQRSLSSAIARVSAATFDSNLLPGNTTYEIGQTGSAWKNIYLSDGTVGSPAYTFGADTNTGFFRPGADILGFSTNSTERMRIDASGNVGIGTTGPTEKLHVIGNILKTGTVSFVQDHPTDSTKQIVYISLEGPEAGTYIRGQGQLINGEAEIQLPDHFSLVTEPNSGLTAQVSPLDESGGLKVIELSNSALKVKELNNGQSNARFYYFVNGIRKGYENFNPIKDKK